MEVLAVALIGGLIGAGVAFPLVRRDLGTRRASLITVVAFVTAGIGSLFVLYGALVAVAAAALAYVVARSRTGVDRALLAAGGSFAAMTLGFAVLLYGSLETM
ncbi:hypothetical protein [Streptomyces spongiae]|uniref:Uncharacterized protein n=1 Tax=Streptomyces spongiae TaxID=565072 RepID=A0A5N8XFZ9_9ACTN|nr:hypothetical protein [Streptomyces spongiae]MPY58369.1 hypothetical protein [Streptomyces spongiae]